MNDAGLPVGRNATGHDPYVIHELGPAIRDLCSVSMCQASSYEVLHRSLCEPHMLSMLSFPDRLVVGDNMLALARSGLSYTHQERARSTS